MARPLAPTSLSRRRAIRSIATGAGAAAAAVWVGNLSALAQEQAMQIHLAASPQAGAAWIPKVLSAQQLQTVGALVELIIPTTDTPGAKTALVDRFIDGVLDAGAAADRTLFLEGLSWLDARSTALFGQSFAAATPAQQVNLLTRLSANDAASREGAVGANFFTAIKTMTIAGYYTTEIGLRQELGDDGRMMLATFEGCTHPEHQ